MSMQDVVSAAKAQFVSDQDAAAEKYGEACYNGGVIDDKATQGTLTQADLDAAISAAVAPLNQQISDLTAKDATDVQAAIDAKAAGDKAVADVQAKLDSLSAKEAPEASAIAALQQSVASLQSVLATLASIANPVVSQP